MEGQLRLFASEVDYRFMRTLEPGESFVCGTVEHHSSPFTVTVNRPKRQAMSVRYTNYKGEVRDTMWEYRDHDVCIVVEDDGAGGLNVTSVADHSNDDDNDGAGGLSA